MENNEDTSEINGLSRDLKGRWSIGNSGRPVGSKNKMREKIKNFLELNFDELQISFDKLEPKEKIFFFISMLQFGLPKLTSATDTEGSDLINQKAVIDYSKLSESTLKEILQNTTITENESDEQ